MIRTIIITFLSIAILGCNSSNKKETEREFSHESIQGYDFDRYVLIKGNNLKNTNSIVQEWAEIFSAGEKVKFSYGKAQHNDWTVIKVSKDSIIDHYNYHNLVYWFLGTPPEDNNYADFSIGISIDKDNQKTYIIYNDYQLREKIATNDDLMGIFQNNEKFILSIPFDEFKITDSKKIPEFKEFLNLRKIEIDRIINDDFNFSENKIEIN
ncbi:hypothetical protein [Roseimarinus sediminis]|uniref:hypothetical protein n=1 Tax=Roseimarinus sediminis TaxID=1610899 RepID=UPI003D24A0F0